jgi:transcriptional regulator with XRE-family HTH domain
VTIFSASDLAGRRIREARQRRGWTVRELADRCAGSGVPQITATVLTNLETRRRSTREIAVGEVLALAQVLGVPPLQLIVPLDAGEKLEVIPGTGMDAIDAVNWIADDGGGKIVREVRRPAPGWTEEILRRVRPDDVLTLVRLIGTAAHELAGADKALSNPRFREENPGRIPGYEKRLPVYADRLMHFAARMEALGYEPPHMTGAAEILKRHSLPATVEEWRERGAGDPAAYDDEEADDAES